MVQDTKVVEVGEDYLNAKKELLENGKLNGPEQIRASLVAFEEKFHHLQKTRAAKLNATKGKGLVSKGTGSSYACELVGTITLS